jgi:hypothetical protein
MKWTENSLYRVSWFIQSEHKSQWNKNKIMNLHVYSTTT